MNPYSERRPLDLTPAAYEDWATYEAEDAYAERPTARPSVEEHHVCMCCDTLTVQDTHVCLSCQRHSAEWAALAADPDALTEMRNASRRATAGRRRVDPWPEWRAGLEKLRNSPKPVLNERPPF